MPKVIKRQKQILEENHIIKENTVSKCKFLKTERKSKNQLTEELKSLIYEE